MNLPYKRIVDFVEGYRLENLNTELPKGTQVAFVLPKAQQYKRDGLTVEVGIGYIQIREDDKYTIMYNNEEIKVNRLDILSTKEQLERIKLQDSTVSSERVILGNGNDLSNAILRLFPDEEDSLALIAKPINDFYEEGDELILYTSTEPDDKSDMESKQLGPLFLNIKVL